MDSLGRQLQRLRLESGWSKRTLAGKLGVSIPSIIRWEEEIAEPNDYNRYKIERFLTGKVRTATFPRRRARIVQLSLFPDWEIGQVQ
jgi:transcriptional regulator with XRE-family HTH domain